MSKSYIKDAAADLKNLQSKILSKNLLCLSMKLWNMLLQPVSVNNRIKSQNHLRFTSTMYEICFITVFSLYYFLWQILNRILYFSKIMTILTFWGEYLIIRICYNLFKLVQKRIFLSISNIIAIFEPKLYLLNTNKKMQIVAEFSMFSIFKLQY